MTPDEMVEKAARALWDAQCAHWGPYRTQLEADGSLCPYDELGDSRRRELAREAAAAIAVLRPALLAEALEEAARVCDARADRDWRTGSGFRDGTALELAAAIRALIPKEA